MQTGSQTIGIISACISAATTVVAAIYWFAGSPAESLAIGVEALAKTIAIFWILGIGFTIASTVAIIALLRGEPRGLPMIVIVAESLLFAAIIISLAVS